jgi:16S rRNA (uracil1498-N3)-methyltransferase
VGGRHGAAVRRVFLAATPVPGAKATLDPEESHHAARVLRLRSGDDVEVFDGQGGAWEATIEESSRDRVTVVVGGACPDTRVEPELRVVIHQAIVRPEKVEWVLQKGTELGVAAFRLIEAERAEAPPPSPSRLARYRRIVMEACKQSGRRVVPELTVCGFTPVGPGITAIALTPGGDVPTLGKRLEGPRTPEVWLAVGPEGGFSDGEIETLSQNGWLPASLGPRVLRTETAGAVAAAIVLHAWGDLGPS